jgi:putative SOS response-associated peptidase YedK
MPVMLTTETAEQWLDEKNQTDIYQPLFEAKLPYPLQAAKIDSAYNQSSNKSAPELLETPTLI